MRQLVVIFVLLLGITIFGTVGIHALSDSTWLEAAYLAVITLTTVGSRDVPRTPEGMVFIIIYMMVGIGIFTYSAFQLGQIIVNADIRTLLEKRRMHQQLEALNDHFIVCGMGRMGTAICEHLEAKRKPFVVIDRDLQRLEEICKESRWLYVHGDATDDSVLQEAGVSRATSMATVLPTDADNVYVVLSARLLCSSIQIVARASEEGAVLKLQRAGATRVISPFSSGAMKMARFMLSPSIEDFLEVTHGSENDLELAEVQIQEDSPYIDRQLSQTDLREKGIMVIGIRRQSGQHIIAPEGTVKIEQGDSLFAFGTQVAVTALASQAE
ncbi:potassium channel protein [Thalassoglobus sp. JC818]|uniref:potassium channel family protein n=1 Tax=Thalassoglobus sp. JC818 TaxID=3232136 RepID=UPI0034578955